MPEQIRDLRGDQRVLRPSREKPPPYRLCRFQPLFLGPAGVPQDEFPPLAEKVRVVRIGFVEQLILSDGVGVTLVLDKLLNERLPQFLAGRSELEGLVKPNLRFGD